MKGKHVNYVHVHHFNKITANLFSITNAKFHISVTEEAMFDVTIDQVFFIRSLSY